MSKNLTKKILVTGATGQIGSELVPELKKIYGKENVVLGIHKRKNVDDLEDSPSTVIDVTNKNLIEDAVQEFDIDTIYHLAAILSAAGEKDPWLAWKVNIDGTYNVLEVAREKKLVKVFCPSSIAAFGPDTPRVNTPQITVMNPKTMYGLSKVTGELLANYYFYKFNVDVRGLRYPGIISNKTLPGGGTTDYAVEIFYEAIKNKKYVCFLKSDTVLPMMYMPDCIKATLNLMDAEIQSLRYHSDYNVAAMSFSPDDLFKEILKIIPDFKIYYNPDHRQKIADSWPQSLDDSSARKDWGWKPDFTLSEMVKDMINVLSKKITI
ncbi:NAD-dependent epimerase/dehydratase family protein [Candidatus Bathyarchaeota archaeon]|nr:NAD-dependent epimerase/dehydratase family protein [Candidatus Bathyarchaeota archaeon]